MIFGHHFRFLRIWFDNKLIFKYTCFFQEQWRCLHSKTPYNYILDTHKRINFWENPQGNVALGFDEGPDFDCPIIDPNDPTWCDANSEGQYYPVKCK